MTWLTLVCRFRFIRAGAGGRIRHIRFDRTMATPAVTAKVLRFVDGQKILLNSLGQNFPAGNFDSFEETLDGLTSHDVENKKLVLDQVKIALTFPFFVHYFCFRYFGSF